MATKAKDLRVDVWEERDRLVITLYDGDKEIATWTDDDAREMFESGYFDRRNLKQSVIDYAREMGIVDGKNPARKKMTLAQAREIARSYQTTLRKNVHGEFVVTPSWDRREESRYYTSDLDDALATAKDMHERFMSSTRRPVMALRQARYSQNARRRGRLRRQAKRRASAYVANPKRLDAFAALPPGGTVARLAHADAATKRAAETVSIKKNGGYVDQIKYEDAGDGKRYVHDFGDMNAFMFLVETVWGRGILIVPDTDKPLWENA